MKTLQIHPDYDDSANHTLIFIHVQKTAGTTLKHILNERYRGKTVATITRNLNHPDLNDILLDDFKSMPDYKKRKLKFVRGHIHFGIHEYVANPYNYITILRDPVDRVISLYYFILQNKNTQSQDYVDGVLQSKDLADYVAQGFAGIDPVICQFLKKSELESITDRRRRLEVAKENLERNFSVIGDSARFDESLILVKRLLNWKITPVYMKANVTKNRPLAGDLSQSAIDLIHQFHENDIEFYGFALGLMERQIRNAGADFSDEVVKLRLLNSFFLSGMDQYENGNLEEAVKYFNYALELEPESPNLHSSLGILYYLTGEAVKAFEHFNECLKRNPYDGDARVNGSQILKGIGQWNREIQPQA